MFSTQATTALAMEVETEIHRHVAFGEGDTRHPFAVVNTNVVNSSVLVEPDCVALSAGAVLPGSSRMDALAVQEANSTMRAAVVREVSDPLPIDSRFWGAVPTSIMQPVETRSIPWCYKKPFSCERFLQYLQPSLLKGHVTNDGPLQKVLTTKIKSFVGSNREVLMACNGTSALHALVAGIGLRAKKQTRWVTQAFTFPSSMQGPLANALVADMDPNLNGPCLAFLEASKESFDGVIITNLFGLQVDILAYEDWCKKNDKYLLLDNAASPIGTFQNGRCIHDAGDGAFISLHETKAIGRGEGGAIFVDPELAPFVHQAMNFGFVSGSTDRIPERMASNWRMSDIAAAAICDHIDFVSVNSWKERLQVMTHFAVDYLSQKGLKLAISVQYPTLLGCLFVDLNDAIGDATVQRLNSHGVEAKRYYRPLASRDQAPKAWELFDKTVCLPFHVGITKEELRMMIDLI
jgi:dTDP-4-amino-4,6-dideoxygalactose transaminase